ncbi:phosphopantetheine-binding protein, partial [Kitasatospora sp. NPDC058406]|uniref:phosphopantetheine-binding protein n=1 Tax=Kitasatospora sp. NPDC058406 TaxID=3346483 RepID=UPI00365596AF
PATHARRPRPGRRDPPAAPPRPAAATVAEPAEPSGTAEPVVVLARLMAEALGLTAVDRHADFFELGGDSIVSIRLVSLARKAGLTLTARQVFEAPTPARLAELAVPAAPAAGTAPAAVRPQDDGTGPLPLPPIAHWLAERGGPVDRIAQARLVLLPAGVLTADLATALQALLDRHAGLRQVQLRPGPPVVWGGNAPPGSGCA